MTLVTSRVGLRHRCDIERDQNAGTPDSWGGGSTPSWQPYLTQQPCRAYVDAARERTSEGEDIVVEERHVIVERNLDIQAVSDRVAQITDPSGSVVLDGPMRIHAVIARTDHLELIVERVR